MRTIHRSLVALLYTKFSLARYSRIDLMTSFMNNANFNPHSDLLIVG